ncbi:hypothetical protein V5799_020872, partial [Amblyomma americanum]
KDTYRKLVRLVVNNRKVAQQTNKQSHPSLVTEMPTATGATGLFVVFLALSSKAFAQSLDRKHPRFVTRKEERPQAEFDGFRQVVCKECRELWEKHSAECLAWECYSELLAEDEQCLQGAVEFNKDGLRPSRDIEHFPSYQEMSEEPKADDSMPYGSLDAPIGWRTIQGEWFQEVRRRSSGYADL